MRNNQDFALGSLLGLACGDALGTTVEFAPRDSFPLHTEITGGGIFKLAPGEWTDDTAMALCLATSLVDCQGFDSKDQLKNYLRWYQDGYLACQHICIDIGLATRKALKLFAETQTDYAGSTLPRYGGNGGIMRLAPAIIAATSRKMAIEYAINSSRTTHASDDCLDAAELLGLILWELKQGTQLKSLLENLPSIKPRGRFIQPLLQGRFLHAKRDEISSRGYVIDTLEASLWCVYHAKNFEEALILAVNLGYDADTVGAVTGQIAGAAWGVKSIPSRWLTKLVWKDRIAELAISTSQINQS